jgi:hypothetical protein
MNKIILQPAGNSAALSHYQETIITPVPLSSISTFLPAHVISDLEQIYPGGAAQIWGATGGGSNATKWNRIAIGDVTLFARNGHIFSSAVVTYKLRSAELATALWGQNSEGQTWEYIFFLDELKQIHILYSQFNQVIGYANNFVIQGFSVLSEERSRPVFEAFDLTSDTYIEEIGEEEFGEVNDRLDELEETDGVVRSFRRLEQGYLKNRLFGKRTLGTCGICQKEFPVSFLVAAHIKKRSRCTLAERIDPNVVMPMCKFGCDDLFEKGYIAVQDGEVISLHRQLSSAFVETYLEKLVGQSCIYYNERTASYFLYHHQLHTVAE